MKNAKRIKTSKTRF